MTDDPANPASSGQANAPGAAVTPETLKAAFKAFKKRWKLTRLDHDSRIGRSPMSSSGNSSIVGIIPPDQFPRAVWDELANQGKIKYQGAGCYSLVGPLQ